MRPFVLSTSTSSAQALSKHEKLFASFPQFPSPFDKLRACSVADTGANVARADKAIVNRLLDYEQMHTSVRQEPRRKPVHPQSSTCELPHETAERLALRLGFEQRIEFSGEGALDDR